MNQKGMTMIEQVCCLALVGIVLSGIRPGMQLMSRVQFQQIVSEIEQGISQTRQMASLTNRTYTIKQISEGIRMSSGAGVPIEKIYHIPSHIEVFIGDKDLEDAFSIEFNGDLSPAKGGTVTLKDSKSKQAVQITIRPVTGKVTVYKDE